MTFGTGRPSQRYLKLQRYLRLTLLKGEKSTLANMVILYIIKLQILY